MTLELEIEWQCRTVRADAGYVQGQAGHEYSGWDIRVLSIGSTPVAERVWDRLSSGAQDDLYGRLVRAAEAAEAEGGWGDYD